MDVLLRATAPIISIAAQDSRFSTKERKRAYNAAASTPATNRATAARQKILGLIMLALMKDSYVPQIVKTILMTLVKKRECRGPLIDEEFTLKERSPYIHL